MQKYLCTLCIQAVTHCLRQTHELTQLLMASSLKGSKAVQDTGSADYTPIAPCMPCCAVVVEFKSVIQAGEH